MLEQRALGRTKFTLSTIGLGCVTFGREIDEEASYEILDYAVEKGITWFDTAESYGGGNARVSRRERFDIDDVREVSDEMGSSEAILGRWMGARGCRNSVTICTKVSSGSSPENIGRALTASLERLRIDYVDIYKLHKPDPDVPLDETLSALAEQIAAGRIRVVGCSNLTAEDLSLALEASESGGLPRFEIIQPPYSLANPGAQDDLFPMCRNEGIAVTPYSPLAAGFLTGKYTPDRAEFPVGSRYYISPGHADIYFTDRNFSVVGRLRAKSLEVGVPMPRLAMA
jgi:aryl-alcohol dehydrogenase-like predicted oxidoreductase